MPITDFMSSEESGEDENENRIIIIKPLSWRASRVYSFCDPLSWQASKVYSFCDPRDVVSKDGKSPQSMCQMKTREIGEVSERPKPSKVASWAIV